MLSGEIKAGKQEGILYTLDLCPNAILFVLLAIFNYLMIIITD